jgi:prepilin-type processing-associated H-X9-DG protein
MNPYQSPDSQAAPPPPAPRTRLLVVVLLFLYMFLVLNSLVISARPAAREAARRAQCQNNLKQIGMALADYHRQFGSFPPAFVPDANGKPLYSWRVLILPFLDQGDLAKQIRRDEAWDGPNNAKSTQIPLFIFDCPSDPQIAKSSADLTSYAAVVGPHTVWPGAKSTKVADIKNPGNTILVVESASSGIHWAEPRDLNFGEIPLAINPPGRVGISSEHPGGVNVLYADGHVGFLDDTTDRNKLAEMLDIEGRSDRAPPSTVQGASR